MELYINEALKRVGETFAFEVDEQLPDQEYGTRELQFLSPATVKGEYTFNGKAFTVTANVKVSLHSVCARCNEPFDEELSFDFSERFIRQTAEEDEESYRYGGDAIVLNEAIMDNLFLQLPLVSVCREDCKGLCPTCGVNRNFEQCDCCNVAPNNAFAVLLERQNEYKEV